MRYNVLARRTINPNIAGASAMLERRQRERRSWVRQPRFPLFDRANKLVSLERRAQPERRINSFLSKWRQSQALLNGGFPRVVLHIQHYREPVEVGDGNLFVGRHSLCDIRIGSKYTSRVHAYFQRCEDGIYLVDKSANGTYLRIDDGKRYRLRRQRLKLERTGLISLGVDISLHDEWAIRYQCV